MVVELNEILNPITPEGRRRLQENFDRIKSQLDTLEILLQAADPSGIQNLFAQITQALGDVNNVVNQGNEAVRIITNATQQSREATLQAQQIVSEGMALQIQLENLMQNLSNQSQEFDTLLPLVRQFTDQQTNLQNQINQLVANGDSSPESAQARVGYDGEIWTTLKQRLDEEIKSVLRSLASPNANLQKNTNKSNTFVGYVNNFSQNLISSSVIDDDPNNLVTRVTLQNPIGANSRLGMNTPSNNTIIFENGKRYRLSFEARSNRPGSLNYSFFLNSTGGNMSFNFPSINTNFQTFEYSFTWNITNANTSILIGSNNLVELGDWIEVKNLIVHEGWGKIPYKPYSPVIPELSTSSQVTSATSDNTYMSPLKSRQMIRELVNAFGIGDVSGNNVSNGSSVNDITLGGFYAVSNTAVNQPTANGYYSLIHISRSTTASASQIAFNIANGNAFYRVKNQNVWQDWINLDYRSLKSTQAQAQNGIDDNTFMSPLRTYQAIDTLTNKFNNMPNNSFNGLSEPIEYPLGTTNFFSSSPTNRFNNFQFCGVFTNIYNRASGASTGFQIITPYRSTNEGNTMYVRFAQFIGTGIPTSWGTWMSLNNQLEIGNLSNLQTSNKNSLVEAINELKNRIDNL